MHGAAAPHNEVEATHDELHGGVRSMQKKPELKVVRHMP